jgi:hypothetical protein
MKIRKEIQEYPNKSLGEAFTEKLTVAPDDGA